MLDKWSWPEISDKYGVITCLDEKQLDLFPGIRQTARTMLKMDIMEYVLIIMEKALERSSSGSQLK